MILPNGNEYYIRQAHTFYNTTAVIIEQYFCNDKIRKIDTHSNSNPDRLFNLVVKEWKELKKNKDENCCN